ncbi:MAG: SpoIIE family protein phosphatase [Lachnospiraceae bacterium]
MKEGKIRKILFYVLAFLSARLTYAGCYTFAPAVFAALFLEKMNRKVLLLATIWGLAIFLPVWDAVRYIAIILVMAVVLKLVECIAKHLRTWWAALIGGASLFLITFCGELLSVRLGRDLWMISMESLLFIGLIRVLNPIVHRILCYKRQKGKKSASVGNTYTGKLRGYASAYEKLSTAFSSGNLKKSGYSGEELGKMQTEVTGKICLSCDMAGVCLTLDNNPIRNSLTAVFKALTNKEADLSAEKEAMETYCVRSHELMQEAVAVFEKTRLNHAWYNRLLENREAIAAQLDSMAYAIGDYVHELEEIGSEQKQLLSNVEYRLKERGVCATGLRLFKVKRERLMLTGRLSVPKAGSVSVRDCAKDVSDGLREKMIPAKDSRTFLTREPIELTFEQEPHFKIFSGVVKKARDGASVSGDNFTLLDLPDATQVIGISDGMGCGSQACKESELVLDLLEGFLEAGFESEVALKMMNSAMVIHGGEESFSTVDLCSVNLFSGVARFYKVGAAPSFILHDGKTQIIVSESLPAGAFQHLEIDRETKKLYHGDYMIQLSDGALDYLHTGNPEETMAEIIEHTKIGKPSRMAEDILEKVLLHSNGQSPDDITVLVSGIWER